MYASHCLFGGVGDKLGNSRNPAGADCAKIQKRCSVSLNSAPQNGDDFVRIFAHGNRWITMSRPSASEIVGCSFFFLVPQIVIVIWSLCYLYST